MPGEVSLIDIFNAITAMQKEVSGLSIQVALNTQSTVTITKDLDKHVKEFDKVVKDIKLDRDTAIDSKITKLELRYVFYLLAGLISLDLYLVQLAIPKIVKVIVSKGG
jgi:hypothetical protein